VLSPAVGVRPVLADAYRQLLFWLGRKPAFSWFGPRVFAPVDTWLYPRTHGTLVSTGPSVLPLLLLTTIGRRSGQQRAVPLLYMAAEDRVVVVASNWGRDKHPAWSDNLLANPAATVDIRKDRFSVGARLVTADERAELWPRLRVFCPVWEKYAERSSRDLRVFALGRVDQAGESKRAGASSSQLRSVPG
jgi:deazaflavin-dependent oxidoreductase (nitroreductase family)